MHNEDKTKCLAQSLDMFLEAIRIRSVLYTQKGVKF